jgi:hypothetical protein
MKITLDWIHDTLWIIQSRLAEYPVSESVSVNHAIADCRESVGKARMEVTDAIVRLKAQEAPRG